MNANVFTGKLVKLVSFDAEKHAPLVTGWEHDSEYARLLSGGPAYLYTPKQFKDWMEKEHDLFFFMLHTVEDDKPIGLVDLSGVNWTAGTAWVGIGLGERDYWGKGYGTEAMNLILGYAFRELNLQRVSLTVFEYNPRAARSYEKAGFQHEGRLRLAMNRDGERWDLLVMGILRDEWEAKQPIDESNGGKDVS